MTHLLDTIAVGIVLAASTVYVAYALGPKSWRAAVARQLGELVPHLPRQLGLRRAAQRLSGLVAAKAGGACGGCGNCGSESAAKSDGTAAGTEALAGRSSSDARPLREVRIAVAKIGRRR
jgi:hypothetical protein